jgi:uncharacterized protein YprB with RNaseH-like and TPR domain/predicted nuclease with RNAse H fold/dephospho-CoA kinase
VAAAPGILTRTFVHVPGIGSVTERALWADGISSWRRFLMASSSRVPIRSRSKVCDFLGESEVALKTNDARFFARYLHRSEWWRLYPHFRTKAVFLDIETTGLSQHYDEVTLVGLYDGTRVKTFLAGNNLDELAESLAPYEIAITFNGTLFDLPFLKNKFPALPLPAIHLDLRYILRRIGYSGPLKRIEQRLGIVREAAADVDGLMATVLWARYLRGSIEALEQLVKYNAADITSLRSLMSFSYSALARQLLKPERPGPSAARLERPKRVFVRVHQAEDLTTRLVVDGKSIVLMDQGLRGPRVSLGDLCTHLPQRVRQPRIVGIDLTGSESRATGLAFLCGDRVETALLSGDAEIEEKVLRYAPDVVSIDSPLGLPRGRCCTKDSCSCRVHGILRECERILWRRGVRVYPCLLPSMQGLTSRGIRIAEHLRKRGLAVIESYPGAAQDIMRIPRKRTSLEDLAAGLRAFGVRLDETSKIASHDELDAVTAALVGVFFWSGRFEALGHEEEGLLIVPSLDADYRAWLDRRVIGLSGPLAAGKTTAARTIEGRGYFYARFSLVLANLLRERGLQPSREALQAIGAEVHRDPGQRWLCRRLVDDLPKEGAIVVDGLRHPEDHAFFVEQYGPSFKHIHVTAPRPERRRRYLSNELNENAFDVAEGHQVESNVERMLQFACVAIENTGGIEDFLRRVIEEITGNRWAGARSAC